jgi:streptogramin lyase
VIATIPLQGRNPAHVATGLGAVWASQIDSQSVARIDPKTNKQTNEIPLQGDQPLDVAVGFGSVWMSAAESGVLIRVNP